jgi:hypothetical protein
VTKMSEIQIQIQAPNFVDVTYVSVWEYAEISTAAKLSVADGVVFDIEKSEVEGDIGKLQVEKIVFGDAELMVQTNEGGIQVVQTDGIEDFLKGESGATFGSYIEGVGVFNSLEWHEDVLALSQTSVVGSDSIKAVKKALELMEICPDIKLEIAMEVLSQIEVFLFG